MVRLRPVIANTQQSFMMEQNQQSSSRVKSSLTMSAAKMGKMTHVLSLMSSKKNKTNALRFSVTKQKKRLTVRAIVALWDGVKMTIFSKKLAISPRPHLSSMQKRISAKLLQLISFPTFETQRSQALQAKFAVIMLETTST